MLNNFAYFFKPYSTFHKLWYDLTICYLTISVGQKSRHGVAGLSAWSHKAKIKVLPGMHSHMELGASSQLTYSAEFVFL